MSVSVGEETDCETVKSWAAEKCYDEWTKPVSDIKILGRDAVRNLLRSITEGNLGATPEQASELLKNDISNKISSLENKGKVDIGCALRAAHATFRATLAQKKNMPPRMRTSIIKMWNTAWEEVMEENKKIYDVAYGEQFDEICDASALSEDDGTCGCAMC